MGPYRRNDPRRISLLLLAFPAFPFLTNEKGPPKRPSSRSQVARLLRFVLDGVAGRVAAIRGNGAVLDREIGREVVNVAVGRIQIEPVGGGNQSRPAAGVAAVLGLNRKR